MKTLTQLLHDMAQDLSSTDFLGMDVEVRVKYALDEEGIETLAVANNPLVKFTLHRLKKPQDGKLVLITSYSADPNYDEDEE